MAKNVLHILRSTAIGGVECQAQLLAGESARCGRGLLMILATDGLVSDEVREWHALRTPFEVLSDQRGGQFGLGRLLRFRKTLRRFPFEVAHFHYALPDSIIWNDVWAAKLAGMQVVVTLHHSLAWTSVSFLQRVKQLVARRAVDQFIATTDFGQALLRQRISRSRVGCIPCATEAILTTTEAGRLEVRARLAELINRSKEVKP